MKVKLLCSLLVLAGVAVAVRAEDSAGKEVALKKCKACHDVDGTNAKKKPMKAPGKDAAWIGKFLDREEKGTNGKPHLFKGQLTDEEKKAVIEYVISVSK